MANVKPKQARARGRPPRVSREAIVATARAIVDAEGIDALTMRRVADELAIVPMAIYRHVRDKDELLVFLLDAAYRELRKPRLPKDPRRRVITLWTFLHAGLERYPWVIEALVRSDLIAPSVLTQMDEIIKSFVDCGLTIAQAADAYRITWQFTVGALNLRAAMLKRMNTAAPSAVVRTLLGVDPREMPTLAAAAQYWFVPPKFLPYEEGLEAILDGLLPNSA